MADANHKARQRFPDRSATIRERRRHGKKTPTPTIRVSGKWIEKAGFHPAGFVRIEVWEDLLVIMPVDESTLDPKVHGVPAVIQSTGIRRRVRLLDNVAHAAPCANDE